MSTSVQIISSSPDLAQPQARRLDVAARIASSQTNGKMPTFKGDYQLLEQAPDSGTATPVPNDAPPSVQATSSARQALRAQNKKRLFPTVDYTPRVSHFDPQSEHRDFRGFFVLFWIGLAIMVLSTALRNVKETGYPFRLKQRDLFIANIWELAVSDLIMAMSTLLCLPLHKLYAAGGKNWFFRWSRGGIWVQSVFQAAWLFYWIDLPFYRNWSWTAQVFLTLHVLSLFMKLHSYAFYMGHLNETQRRLNELDQVKSMPAKRRKVVRYPSATGVINEIHPDAEHEKEQSPVQQLTQLREDLATELTSPLGNVSYPQNMTYANFMDYLCCPTLCYELEYPRLEKRSWSELFYKTIAVFGCVFLLTLVTEEFIIPVLDEAAIRLQATTQPTDFLLLLAETISTMLFPFMVCFLLVFLVIFEYICGAFAEITRFADRHFYDDWWNTTDWLGFSREWNIPVHNFFRRHVYLAIQSSVGKPTATGRAPRYSRVLATTVTFFISAIAHELILGCITKKLRGYGLIAMMLQMPLVMIQRSPLMRDRKLLNNILFWISMILGLSMMCTLYVLV